MNKRDNAQAPNDPKLSEGRGWRGPCMAGGKAAAEARAVTAVAVRCSAWLGAFVQICAEWDNRAKQNFMLGDAVSEARALTYVSCAAEIRVILASFGEGSSHTQEPVQESNCPQEP